MSVNLVSAEQYRDVAIFENLTDEEIGLMLASSTRIEVAPGQAIFKEGDPVDSFYILESGKCVVRKTNENGGEVDLAILTPKAAFGEMGLVGKKPRIASVYAMEPSVVRRIPRADFERLVAEGHAGVTKVALNMARILSDRLDALNREFSKLMSKQVAMPVKNETNKRRLEELQKFKEQLYKEWAF